ncbi:MAG: hypothetical protein ACJA2O_004390 [Candidatus Azotimanducaceae bacterium]|jgi:hypothetical protein
MMNPLQKPADFSRTVFEINQNAFKEILGSQKDNIQKYFELNSSFSKKLPEVAGVTGFMELQKEYGESLWTGVKDATTTQTGIIKNAVEETGEALRKVFTVASED